MNICFLTEEHIGSQEPQVRGGIVYIRQMFEHLSKNHNVTIICWKNSFSFNPPIYSIKNMGRILNFFFSLIMAYRVGKERNINIFISRTRKFYLPGLIAAKLLHVPHVAHVGSLPEKGKRFIKRIDKGIFRILLKLPHDKYLAVGETVRNTLIEMGIAPPKIHNISNAVDIDMFKKQDKNECKKKLNLSNGKIITFVGSFHKYKGIYPALEAFSKIKEQNIFLLLVGDGPEYYNLKKEVDNINLQDRVIFYGKVKYEMMPVIYGASDVVILPSFTEGISHVILESSASEVPVVATKVGGTPEIIEDEVNGFLVEPGDVKTMEKQIKKLLNSENLRLKMGRSGREKIEKNGYTWNEVSNKHERILAEVEKIWVK